MACDEGVVQQTNAPRAYAACLASLAERRLNRDRRAEALSLSAWRRRPELVHRVHRILSRRPALNPIAARVLLGSVACALLAGSVTLARCPQLVAFVAAPKPQELAQADAVYTDRPAYTPVNALAKTASAAHMVDTKAILPPIPQAAALEPVSASHTATHAPAIPENELASRDAQFGTQHATMLKAEMPSAHTKQAAQQNRDAQHSAIAPEYFVFTAYEQVETLPQNSREISDYDTSSAADPQTANQAQSALQQSANANTAPTTHITVTRLIFRIDPASLAKASATAPASDSTAKPTTFSKPVHQPAIIPFGNGWLLFHL
jgi:hypothetical protein